MHIELGCSKYKIWKKKFPLIKITLWSVKKYKMGDGNFLIGLSK